MWCSRALGVILQITKARNNLAQSYRLVVVVEKRDRERESKREHSVAKFGPF